ncbi:MAG: ABC transporter ATP-binding protein [Oscillospiraceae bacterium]|nr:ABC transporter ATP-binding protein [Oscillospiraceae bacterium]
MRGHGKRGGVGAPVEKAKDFKGSVKSLLKYIGKYKIAIIIVLIFAVGSTVFNVVGPKILGNATTELFNGVISKYTGGIGIDFGKIAGILLGLLFIYLTSSVCGFIQNYLMSTVTQKVGFRMRSDISKKINLLPMNFFDRKQTGETLSIITNDVDTLCMSLNQVATQAVTSVSTIIGVLYMMFSISWIMTIIALVILPVSLVFVSIIAKLSQKHFRNQQDYLGHVNGHIEETISGVNIVQAFNTVERNEKEFDKSNEMLYKSAWKSQFLSGLMGPVMQLIGNIAYVAIAVLGGYLAIQGTITVGNIQSFIQYVRQFTQPIQQMAQVSNMVQQMTAAAERIFEFLGEEEEPQKAENHCKKPNGDNITVEDITGNVTFDHVKFGYNPDKIIIHDFSAEIKQGQKIAIVGPTGAGKTTMIKLLMRFYDLNGGHILVDGYDITDFDRSELRELYGMVLQDTWLFTGSIMENIRYGKLDATDEEVINAAKAAHVHSFVKHLPNGYNMELNEEASNVSQGQKQLLTIARTILADPKILILDEATSSVDTRTEVRIQRAMDNLMKGRTSFIIAHRLSTIRDADLIFFMKDGDIVEQGNHDELIAKDGFYAELYNSQFDKVG